MTVAPRLALFAARIGFTGALLAIAIAALAVQTVRLDGLRIGPIAVEGWHPKAQRLARELKAVAVARDEAARRARAENARAETAYRELAQRIDDNANSHTGEAMDAADRYIVAHRVRPQTADCPPGGTFSPSRDPGTRHPETAGRPAELDEAAGGADEGMVIVKASDVRICTSNTLKAEAARDWANALEGAR